MQGVVWDSKIFQQRRHQRSLTCCEEFGSQTWSLRMVDAKGFLAVVYRTGVRSIADQRLTKDFHHFSASTCPISSTLLDSLQSIGERYRRDSVSGEFRRRRLAAPMLWSFPLAPEPKAGHEISLLQFAEEPKDIFRHSNIASKCQGGLHG